jgi:hypothetical protein
MGLWQQLGSDLVVSVPRLRDGPCEGSAPGLPRSTPECHAATGTNR